MVAQCEGDRTAETARLAATGVQYCSMLKKLAVNGVEEWRDVVPDARAVGDFTRLQADLEEGRREKATLTASIEAMQAAAAQSKVDAAESKADMAARLKRAQDALQKVMGRVGVAETELSLLKKKVADGGLGRLPYPNYPFGSSDALAASTYTPMSLTSLANGELYSANPLCEKCGRVVLASEHVAGGPTLCFLCKAGTGSTVLGGIENRAHSG